MNFYFEFRDIGADGDEKFLKHLILYKVDAQKSFSRHAMFWACRYGLIKSVNFLIDKNIDFHFEEEICLKWSCENGHFDTAKLLIEKGADIHTKEDYALSIACRMGHYFIVKLLIEHGAIINTWDNQPLLWASQRGNKQIAQFLIKNGAKPTQDVIIKYLCFREDIDSIKAIIENGSSINQVKEALLRNSDIASELKYLTTAFNLNL